MMEQLPQEIVDTIFDYISGRPQDEFLPKRDTSILGYTLVNRSFSSAARRRLFSTIYVNTSELNASNHKLRTLLNLLQASQYLISLVQTFSLKLATCTMSSENDNLLYQIICTLEMSPNLSRLCIGGNLNRRLTSIDTLWLRSTQAIQNMLPKIQDLTLSMVMIPYDFFQGLEVLQRLRLEDATINLDDQTILPQSIRSIIIRGHKSRIDKWYMHNSQTLPGFRNCRVEEYTSNSILSGVLSNSMDTLSTLEIHQTRVEMVFTPDVDLSLFGKLTTISLSFDVASSNRPLNEARRVLELAASWLSSNESTLTHIQITINHLSWVPLYDESSPFDRVEPLVCLNPVQLRKRHPDLQLLAINIPLSRCKMHFPHMNQILKEDLQRALAFMKTKLETAILGSPGIADSGISVCVGGTMGPDMENVTTVLAGHWVK